MDKPSVEKWAPVAKIEEFAGTDRKCIDLGGEKQVGLFKVGDEFHAVSAWCSHEKRSLMDGELDSGELMCPAHGARFDVRTGKHLSLPAVRPIQYFATKIENDTIFIKDE